MPPDDGSTVEVCQLWIKNNGEIVKVLRRGKPVTEYVGKSLDEIMPILEADGWSESGRWNAADAPNQIRIAFQRSKAN
ncbi:MAG: hypothetical protein U0694_08500 [Anaerolineae bacterium]